MRNPSPLRYPESKHRFVPYLCRFLEANFLVGSTVCETHAGGASVSLSLLQYQLIRYAILVERDPLVYCFCLAVFNYTDELCRVIRDTDVTLQTWKRLAELRRFDHPIEEKQLEMAYAGLFFNRTNYSGIIGANPIGGMSQGSSSYRIDCRFNKREIIKRIECLADLAGIIEVRFGDATTVIENLPRCIKEHGFIYADPPYFAYGWKFYRFHYNQFDHKRLRDALVRATVPWLISYDSHNAVCSLCESFTVRRLSWYHTARTFKVGAELLISNCVLPPVERVEAAARGASEVKEA